MAVTRPTDGFGIYEVISPGAGQAQWGPRLDRIAAAGFRLVLNYALLYDTTANMRNYINYAASVGLKVIIDMNAVCSPHSGSLAVQYPTIYVEAGSPGTTAFNAFGSYVVNQVKDLHGTWGYYIADEPQDSNHATILSFFGAVQAADSTRPVLIICDSDTSTAGISNFWNVHTVTWTDCCTVGGDDFYPLGLTGRSDDMATVSTAIETYNTAHTVNRAIVLQAFNFHSYEPTLVDLLGNLNQCLAHMTPQVVMYYSYHNLWGGPSSLFDSGFPLDVNAAVIWDSLARTIASVPSYYIQTVLQDSPTHLYRLDDPLCYTNANDLITNQQISNGNLLRQQTSLLAGDLDPSCHFNGTNSSLTLTTTGFPTTGAFTLELWCSYDSFPGASNYPGVIGLGTPTTHEAAEISFDGDANRLAFSARGVGQIYALAAPEPYKVYHLVGTYDGTTATFYVNGVLQGTNSTFAFNITYGAAYIGRLTDGWNMTGYIKDVALYSRSLSADRVLAHYNAGIEAQALYRSPFRIMGNGHGGSIW